MQKVSSDDIYLDGTLSFVKFCTMLCALSCKQYFYTVIHYPRLACTVLQWIVPVLFWTALLKVRSNVVDLAKSGVIRQVLTKGEVRRFFLFPSPTP
jgi:hypothetical protein